VLKPIETNPFVEDWITSSLLIAALGFDNAVAPLGSYIVPCLIDVIEKHSLLRFDQLSIIDF